MLTKQIFVSLNFTVRALRKLEKEIGDVNQLSTTG